ADRAEASALKAQQAAGRAQKHADSAAVAASKALEHAKEAQQALERAEAADRERLEQVIESGADLTPDQEKELLDELTPQEREEYLQAKKDADQDILDFVKENGLEFLGDLIFGELKKCVTKPSVGACFWAVVDLLPWGKLKKLGNVWDLFKKYKKFSEGVQKGRKKVNEIFDKARKRKKDRDDSPSCEEGARRNSFLRGTPVLLADGSSRAIDQLRIGDQVLATDPVTNTTAGRPVTDTIVGVGDKKLVDITIGTETITATHNHPFWVPERGEWVDAEALSAGQWLRTSAGTHVQIGAIGHRAEPAEVHNLTVADIHTFYVVAGKTPVLVHNCGDIALGKQDVDGDDSVLDLFGFERGAQTYKDWGDDLPWHDHLKKFVADGKTRIHVNLDGIADPKSYAASGKGVDYADPVGRGFTRWEMYLLSQSKDAWGRITFYRKGKKVDNPFQD
ncbi:polymorphic toxin-type HINT domain-containing protein, partial [Couchioplanes caeruleus]